MLVSKGRAPTFLFIGDICRDLIHASLPTLSQFAHKSELLHVLSSVDDPIIERLEPLSHNAVDVDLFTVRVSPQESEIVAQILLAQRESDNVGEIIRVLLWAAVGIILLRCRVAIA